MKQEIAFRLMAFFEGLGELVYSLLEDIAIKLWKLSI
jgi:hypothetical protein